MFPFDYVLRWINLTPCSVSNKHSEIKSTLATITFIMVLYTALWMQDYIFMWNSIEGKS